MSSEPKVGPESDTDSMAEYGDGDTGNVLLLIISFSVSLLLGENLHCWLTLDLCLFVFLHRLFFLNIYSTILMYSEL